MKKIFVAVIVLILAVVAFLFFQSRKKPGTQTPAVPAEFQPSNIYIDSVTKKETVHHPKNLEPDAKRFLVHTGKMDVLPPCPEDTHEENGFCRKDLSIFIGAGSVDLDISCRPDQCDVQCKKACEDAAGGEKCTLREDISKECLKNFPPEKQAQDEAELREQGSQCRERYGSYFEHYRCKYSTSEHDLFRYEQTASDEECRQMYDAYQKCRDAIPQRITDGGSFTPGEEEKRCSYLLSNEFTPARCEVAWTETDQRPYGRSVADKVICNFTCF